MNAQIREKREFSGVFTFDSDECRSLDEVTEICYKFRQIFHDKEMNKMVNDSTGEEILAEEFTRVEEILECLLRHDNSSWTLMN